MLCVYGSLLLFISRSLECQRWIRYRITNDRKNAFICTCCYKVIVRVMNIRFMHASILDRKYYSYWYITDITTCPNVSNCKSSLHTRSDLLDCYCSQLLLSEGSYFGLFVAPLFCLMCDLHLNCMEDPMSVPEALHVYTWPSIPDLKKSNETLKWPLKYKWVCIYAPT